MARRRRSRIVLALCALGFGGTVCAADFEVTNAWIRLLPAGVPAGGYFSLRNNSAERVALVAVTSSGYRSVMMHQTKEEGGTSRMLGVESIEIPAKSAVAFAPGGYHLMLIGATRALAPGDRVPVTLEFSDKHKITAQFEVRAPASR